MNRVSLSDTSVFCAIIVVILSVLGLCPQVSGQNLNCTSVNNLLESRNINITDVPKQPISGEDFIIHSLGLAT